MKRLILPIGTASLVLAISFTLMAVSRASAPSLVSAAPADDAKPIRLVKNPAPAPAFALQDLDGNTISLDDLHGKVVILAFWATWCAPCRAEIPGLISLQRKYPDQLQIVGLSVDDGPVAAVKQFVQKVWINYPVAIVPPGLQEKYGGVGALPTVFVLDTKGGVVQKHVGLQPPELLENEVRALLDMPVAAPIERFEDNGQILLANVSRATELPGVDFSKLDATQRKVALRQLNERKCTCGCDFTLAECRVNDTECAVSLSLAGRVVESVAHPKTASPPPPSRVANR